MRMKKRARSRVCECVGCGVVPRLVHSKAGQNDHFALSASSGTSPPPPTSRLQAGQCSGTWSPPVAVSRPCQRDEAAKRSNRRESPSSVWSRHSGTAWRVLTKLRVNLGLPIATMAEYHHGKAACAVFGRLRAPVVITTTEHANAAGEHHGRSEHGRWSASGWERPHQQSLPVQ